VAGLSAVVLCLAFAGLVPAGALAASESSAVLYSNPDIGLELSYPNDWKAVDPAFRDRAGESGKSVMEKLSFGIHKPYRVPKGFDDANLMILAVRVDDDTCAAVENGSLESGEAAEFPRTIPGGRLSPSRHVRVRGLRGYTGEHVSSLGLTVVQHSYWYCFGHRAVIVQSTSGTPESEQALAGILSSIRISGH
jgi:hypothetical protein